MKAYELLELTRLILRRPRKWKIEKHEEDIQIIHKAFAALETVTGTHPDALAEIIRALMKEQA